MNEWNIQSRGHACQACGRHFVDQQAYHTLLLDERREVHRIDVCESCWAEGQTKEASQRPGFVSHWQGIYEPAPAAAPDPIKKENAETLLRKIIERNDSRFVAASYILAVMLERKRVLKVKEQFVREGQRIFIYEQPRTADLFTITDPGLQLNQLEEVQRDVATLLEDGLPDGDSVATPTDDAPTAGMESAATAAPADPAEGSADKPEHVSS
jgi:hypothetical protein